MNTIGAPDHVHSQNPQEESRAIDEEMRHWYDSCPSCLSEAYPAIKEAIDMGKNIQIAQLQTVQPILKDGQGVEPAMPRQEDDWGIGGEPACWAHLVCQECGAMTTEGHRQGCSLAHDTV